MIYIIGQGLAGTLLAWELERAGLPFRIFDPGHERAASRVAAGIINPVTGQRFVRTWRVDALLPLARDSYRALGAALRVDCWREMRVRRLFRDDAERKLFRRRAGTGELQPYVGPATDDGFWIEDAAAVDVGGLITAARRRWRESGQLVEERFVTGRPAPGAVLWCTGVELPIACVSVAKGEILSVAVRGLDPGTIINRGHWLLPGPGGTARVGATYAAGATDTEPTAAARAELESFARSVGKPVEAVLTHEAGSRLTTTDKRPVAGWISPGVGVCGALGSKGALFAPWLARQWSRHLLRGEAFERDTDIRPGQSSHSGPAGV